jgi:hypothetical protein
MMWFINGFIQNIDGEISGKFHLGDREGSRIILRCILGRYEIWGFARRWRQNWWFSRFLHRVVFWLYTDVSEDRAAFNPEDGGSTLLRNVGIHPPRHTTPHGGTTQITTSSVPRETQCEHGRWVELVQDRFPVAEFGISGVEHSGA